MAEFYGYVKGNRGIASRLGSKRSGFSAVAASWQGAVSVDLQLIKDETVVASVYLTPHEGQGITLKLYEGPVNGAPVTLVDEALRCRTCGHFEKCSKCTQYCNWQQMGDKV
jgi:hypothetical protein